MFRVPRYKHYRHMNFHLRREFSSPNSVLRGHLATVTMFKDASSHLITLADEIMRC
jgi:hypothetical protein